MRLFILGGLSVGLLVWLAVHVFFMILSGGLRTSELVRYFILPIAAYGLAAYLLLCR